MFILCTFVQASCAVMFFHSWEPVLCSVYSRGPELLPLSCTIVLLFILLLEQTKTWNYVSYLFMLEDTNEPPHDKTNKITCAPSEDSDQGAQADQSSLSAWRNIGPLTTYWAHSEDWSDWADFQADWVFTGRAMSFCFFMWRLKLKSVKGISRRFWVLTSLLFRNKCRACAECDKIQIHSLLGLLFSVYAE